MNRKGVLFGGSRKKKVTNALDPPKGKKESRGGGVGVLNPGSQKKKKQRPTGKEEGRKWVKKKKKTKRGEKSSRGFGKKGVSLGKRFE